MSGLIIPFYKIKGWTIQQSSQKSVLHYFSNGFSGFFGNCVAQMACTECFGSLLLKHWK
jgi:hypothetical protein